MMSCMSWQELNAEPWGVCAAGAYNLSLRCQFEFPPSKRRSQANWSSDPVQPIGQANRSSRPVEPVQAGQAKYPHKASRSSVRHVTSLDPLIINRNLLGHNITSHCGLPHTYNSISNCRCSQPCIVLWSKYVQTRCCTVIVAQSTQAFDAKSLSNQHFGAPICWCKMGLPKQRAPCSASIASTKAYSPAPKAPLS